MSFGWTGDITESGYKENTNMKHLEEIQMGYFEHLYHAWSMAFALLVHGIFPSLFTHYVRNKMYWHEDEL
jgi:hypothetical protein